jgi:hypothetical protein
MKAKFYINSGQPKVIIDGEWNALSLFLESDSSTSDVRSHIELKRGRALRGNVSVVRLISGSSFKVSTELDIELASVTLFQKQLLKLIDVWGKFKSDRKPCIINV